ncbi:hypothetical protein M8J75_015777 [Diaphorina citri]|nr:hypothetical protein M8J75_015777 [Diaphorina citri]
MSDLMDHLRSVHSWFEFEYVYVSIVTIALLFNIVLLMVVAKIQYNKRKIKFVYFLINIVVCNLIFNLIEAYRYVFLKYLFLNKKAFDNMRSLAEIQKILTGSKENIPEVLDQIKAAYLKNNQTAKYISCDILEHIQYIVLYVYMFTLIAISIDRYRYIKYENVNIQARYSSLFINLYIW